ncbi:formimidoylglutamase [Leeia sp.]|uniref:formimidoylglutamase n=1 Tax=Leeia sp. TaxID=2884678 RepID=UPI0035B1BEE4
MFQHTDFKLWQGRVDDEEGERALRWHQQVQALQAGAAPGFALLGFACDAGVARNQGRTGAKAGPDLIRKALANLAWHHPQPVYDGGSVVCEGDALEASQALLGTHVATAMAARHTPIVLGGGHEIAWGSWQGLAAHAASLAQPPRIGILNFDAHFDLRQAARASSGTPFRQIAEDCQARGWPFHYACLGVAETANTQALFARAESLGVWWRTDQQMLISQLPAIRAQLETFLAEVDWLYLSIDLDVLPAAVAPGVSAPAAHGVELPVIEALLDDILRSGKLKLADLAEFNPQHDQDHRTAKVAARLVWLLARGV